MLKTLSIVSQWSCHMVYAEIRSVLIRAFEQSSRSLETTAALFGGNNLKQRNLSQSMHCSQCVPHEITDQWQQQSSMIQCSNVHYVIIIQADKIFSKDVLRWLLQYKISFFIRLYTIASLKYFPRRLCGFLAEAQTGLTIELRLQASALISWPGKQACVNLMRHYYRVRMASCT